MQKLSSVAIIVALLLYPLSVIAGGPENHVWINRSAKTMIVFDGENREVYRSSIGIGRGGLKEKKGMSDLITPTGSFSVDIILHQNSRYNAVSPEVILKYKNHPEYSKFFNEEGLTSLFGNMNRLDFDGNGSSDNAYGMAYVGLHSDNAVTGPKMRKFKGTPYWYSIALHTTPLASSIGSSNSGGCVHVTQNAIAELVESGRIRIGSRVEIADSFPPWINE